MTDRKSIRKKGSVVMGRWIDQQFPTTTFNHTPEVADIWWDIAFYLGTYAHPKEVTTEGAAEIRKAVRDVVYNHNQRITTQHTPAGVQHLDLPPESTLAKVKEEWEERITSTTGVSSAPLDDRNSMYELMWNAWGRKFRELIPKMVTPPKVEKYTPPDEMSFDEFAKATDKMIEQIKGDKAKVRYLSGGLQPHL